MKGELSFRERLLCYLIRTEITLFSGNAGADGGDLILCYALPQKSSPRDVCFCFTWSQDRNRGEWSNLQLAFYGSHDAQIITQETPGALEIHKWEFDTEGEEVYLFRFDFSFW